jgi:hypothetical protein
MDVFRCPSCSSIVFYPNLSCGACGANLGWDPASHHFVTAGSFCSNRQTIGCNWISWRSEGGLCWSCDMTEVVPDAFPANNVELWSEAELAKRRVLTTLGRWGWFTANDPGPLPQFHLLSEETRYGDRDVVMAHDCGMITINVTEADLSERIERGEQLGEKLRTMTGHFRHELAHFLFERLSRTEGFLEAFRAIMGDERADYGAALTSYYQNGPPPGWENYYITRYASAHPHEDWAETVTHLLHLTDITDSAVAVNWRSHVFDGSEYDVYAETDTDRLIELGSYFSMAVNHINRSIGRPDLYPFVLRPKIREKLAFVHQSIRPRM